MIVADLVGRIAALYLRRHAPDSSWTAADGNARFLIDGMSPELTRAIALATLADNELAPFVEIKLPARIGQGLPPEVLTDKPATYWRTATSDRRTLLFATASDDEKQSLAECPRIGEPELVSQPDLWVQVACEGLNLTPESRTWWEKALNGLQGLRAFALERLAAYVIRTRDAISTDGLPLLGALGAALPALHLPCDRSFFSGIKERQRGHTSEWRRQFESLLKRRACFLVKRTPAQQLLSEDDLMRAFNRVKDDIPETTHEAVLAFIAAPSGWNAQAEVLANFEWEEVKPIFDGLRRERYSIGQATIAFFNDRDPQLALTPSEDEYLKTLIARATTEAKDEDAEFYERHRDELRADAKLKAAWDRFVHGKPHETSDFLAGLAACLESLFDQDAGSTSRKLRIVSDSYTKKDFKEINVDAGLYFAHRYLGLPALIGNGVKWDAGQLFDFPALVAEWRERKTPLNHTRSRHSMQLKFRLELDATLPNGGSQLYSTHLIWRFDPDTVASQLVDDWSRLKEHPLVFCRTMRHRTGSRRTAKPVDLSSVKTFTAAYDRDRGSFVAAYRPANDIATLWRRNLHEARKAELLTESDAGALKASFDAFESAYSAALKGLRSFGLAFPGLQEQADRYAELLEALCIRAKGDRNRDSLLRPILQIGAVAIEGGGPTVVVAPWHPLRLGAIAQKAVLVAKLVRHLLDTAQVFFGDTRLFFRDIARELAHPFYPEVVVGWHGDSPELLALTDSVQDYSLHEPPLVDDGAVQDTNENPADGSNCVADLLRRYVALQPHEYANLSVVLYNCDSARLPQAVVNRLAALDDDADDLRCQVLLRHIDAEKLRALYTDIIKSSEDDDTFNPSEATQDFMARLRICIIADQAPPPDPTEGRPYDLVFLQDVIARHAKLEWYVSDARPVEPASLVPARWSRRRPAAKDDMKSVVFLCCPVQSRAGWAFLTAQTTFLRGDWDGDNSSRLLPARQLDFRDPRTSKIFKEAHDLGNWVVNYDELLDRRQLFNQEVQVIRYKQSATQGRNVIISSRASLALLRTMVTRRLDDLGLGLSDADTRKLADKFILEASDISGDIVLRAAKRGQHASELIGVVLSRYLVRHEIGADQYVGWYFLDDYAEWLGQREEQIADILALSPSENEKGDLRLTMIVTEAKYVSADALAPKRKESQKQLRDTMRRIRDALFGSPERLDRDLWLARLSDLILDGVKFPASAHIDLTTWRRALREGGCGIYLRGYSHVFVPGPGDAADCASFASVPELDGSFQEVFGRAEVRDLVLRFSRGENPTEVRRKAADHDVWGTPEFLMPTTRTVLAKGKGTKRGGGAAGPSAPTPPTPPTPPVAPVPPDVVSGAPPGAGPPSPTPNAPSNTPENAGAWANPRLTALLSGGGPAVDDSADVEWLKQVEVRTRSALQQWQLQAKLLTSVLTPNSGLLRFAGTASLTVDQLLKRRSELLTTHGLEVVSVQPEPGAITLAIARPSRRVVRLQDVWSRWVPNSANGNTELAIAIKEANGELLYLSPENRHAPHTLIAGSTGSGKSVLMQNIILGIAATNTPAQAEIILIDPKLGVDYFAFDGLPHIRGGVIDDQETALARLGELVEEMDRRYRDFFKPARVSNITAYNKKTSPEKRLPVIWLIHDEFAEWMLIEEYKQQVTSIVSRLGVKARAAGIYLVFAAQRPDANVMPMQLRANLGNRLILRVDSEGTSEIALGEPGAERLLGRGHLLARLDGETGLQFGQVPFIDPDYIEQMVAAIAGKPSS